MLRLRKCNYVATLLPKDYFQLGMRTYSTTITFVEVFNIIYSLTVVPNIETLVRPAPVHAVEFSSSVTS